MLSLKGTPNVFQKLEIFQVKLFELNVVRFKIVTKDQKVTDKTIATIILKSMCVCV